MDINARVKFLLNFYLNDLNIKDIKYKRSCGIYFVKIGRGYNDNETIDNSLKTKLSFGYSLLLNESRKTRSRRRRSRSMRQ